MLTWPSALLVDFLVHRPLAFLDRDAEQHGQIRESMAQVLRDREAITHNYVLVETEALAHRRLGGRAVRALLEDVVPALEVVWVDANLHDTAVDAHLGGRCAGAPPWSTTSASS
jgi:hypothetical protein